MIRRPFFVCNVIIIVVLLAILFVKYARADGREPSYPVSIPFECAAVAERERYPTIIENKVQALRAKARLAALSPRDRLANECRSAIRRIQQEFKP